MADVAAEDEAARDGVFVSCGPKYMESWKLTGG